MIYQIIKMDITVAFHFKMKSYRQDQICDGLSKMCDAQTPVLSVSIALLPLLQLFFITSW